MRSAPGLAPRLALGLALALLASACTSPQPAAELSGPRLIALGTAQDGGLPHASCGCPRCERARSVPATRRLVACLGLVFPDTGSTYLIDATPDLPEQLERLRAQLEKSGALPARASVDRSPLSGILLTHAHMGHYTGLMHLGFEVVHTSELDVFASPRMSTFLRTNGPWSQLVEKREITLRELTLDQPFELEAGVRITPFPVPHRDELSDTLAFRIDGPRTSVLYVPDTDDWELWSPSLAERLEGIDVALLDGSFYALQELPGRSLEEVRHPLMQETIARLAERVETTPLEVLFTHLNHSNLALGPDASALKEVERCGFGVLAENQSFEL